MTRTSNNLLLWAVDGGLQYSIRSSWQAVSFLSPSYCSLWQIIHTWGWDEHQWKAWTGPWHSQTTFSVRMTVILLELLLPSTAKQERQLKGYLRWRWPMMRKWANSPLVDSPWARARWGFHSCQCSLEAEQVDSGPLSVWRVFEVCLGMRQHRDRSASKWLRQQRYLIISMQHITSFWK